MFKLYVSCCMYTVKQTINNKLIKFLCLIAGIRYTTYVYSTAATILQLKELGVTLAGTPPFIRERHISMYVLCKSDPVLFVYSYRFTELHQLSMTDSAHSGGSNALLM